MTHIKSGIRKPCEYYQVYTYKRRLKQIPDCGLKPMVAVFEISAAESLELSLKVSAISKILLLGTILDTLTSYNDFV